jgi:hypothetical protein
VGLIGEDYAATCARRAFLRGQTQELLQELERA